MTWLLQKCKKISHFKLLSQKSYFFKGKTNCFTTQVKNNLSTLRISKLLLRFLGHKTKSNPPPKEHII